MKISSFKFIPLLFALINFAPTPTQAQTNSEVPRALFGVRLMPTVSTMKMKTPSGGVVNSDLMLGFGFGVQAGYQFNRHIGAVAELVYSTITQQYKENNVDRRINMRYINIPLLLSLNTGKLNPINLNVVAGPQIGISVGHKVYTSGGNGTDQAILSMRGADLGFAYGAGFDFGLNAAKTYRLDLGYRGVLGLVDVSDNSGPPAPNSYYIIDDTRVNTHSLYVGISLLF